MNTYQLLDSTELIRQSNGVFSIDRFINIHLEDGIYIVNTHPSSKPGEHWFIVEKSQSEALVFDSYGFLSPMLRSPFAKSMFEHISFYCTDVKLTNVTLQSIDTNVCGDYCLFYITARNQGEHVISIIQSLLQFNNSHERDHAVRRVIIDNFKTIPDDGNGVDRVHIFSNLCK